MIKLISFFAMMVVSVAALASSSAVVPSGLPGTWELVSRVDRDTTGKIIPEPSLGTDPIGYLIYDNTGHVSAQLSARHRTTKSCTVTSERSTNNSAQTAGYDSYFGRYEVDAKAGIVTHILDGALSPGDVGRRVQRRFHLNGDTLIIQFEPGGPGVTRTITWRRISK